VKGIPQLSRGVSEKLEESGVSEDLLGLVRRLEDYAWEIHCMLRDSERWRKAYQKGRRSMIAEGGLSEELALQHLPHNEGYLDARHERFCTQPAIVIVQRMESQSLQSKDERPTSTKEPKARTIKL